MLALWHGLLEQSECRCLGERSFLTTCFVGSLPQSPYRQLLAISCIPSRMKSIGPVTNPHPECSASTHTHHVQYVNPPSSGTYIQQRLKIMYSKLEVACTRFAAAICGPGCPGCRICSGLYKTQHFQGLHTWSTVPSCKILLVNSQFTSFRVQQLPCSASAHTMMAISSCHACCS